MRLTVVRVGALIGIGVFLYAKYYPENRPAPVQPPIQQPAFTYDYDAVDGIVQPFKIISAIRNFAFQRGMVGAQISVSVTGGKQADWMATAAYIAEHSIVNGATFSEVLVVADNPWGDNPPQEYETLARAYYAPDPARSPWSEQWLILAANRFPTLADIEYDHLGNDSISDRIADPGKRLAVADAQAKRAVVRKYRLPANWQPAADHGINGKSYPRTHVRIVDLGADTKGPVDALNVCLASNVGYPFAGCDNHEFYKRS